MFSWLFLVVLGVSLFQDEKGVLDWHTQHLGPYSDAFFLSPSRVLLSSQNGGLAMYEAEKIVWRRDFSGVRPCQLAQLDYREDRLRGVLFQMFNLHEGQLSIFTDVGGLIWQKPVFRVRSAKIMGSRVITLNHEGQLIVRTLESGQVVQEVETRIQRGSLIIQGDLIFVRARNGISQSFQLHPQTQNLQTRRVILKKRESPQMKDHQLVFKGNLLYEDPLRGKLLAFKRQVVDSREYLAMAYEDLSIHLLGPQGVVILEQGLATLDSVRLDGPVILGVSSRAGTLYCLDQAGGRLVWSLFLGEPVKLSATNGGEPSRVIRVTSDSRVYHVDLYQGILLDRQDQSPHQPPQLVGTPAHVYVKAQQNSLTGLAYERSTQTYLARWQINLPFLEILEVQPAIHTENDFIPVDIRSDASLIYKYVNPNLMSVVSKTSVGLSWSFLDAASGTLLATQLLPHLVGPFKTVVCENFALLHAWNMQDFRYEVFVAEFYESRQDTGPMSVIFQRQKDRQMSTYELDAPYMVIHGFIMPMVPVASISVTTSAKGVTPKHVLFSLDNGMVWSVPKLLLNARRPMAHNADEDSFPKIPSHLMVLKDDPIPPYSAAILLNHKQVLSYDLNLRGMRTLIAGKGDSESTSLVFGAGRDLYFRVFHPALKYDGLGKHFNYHAPWLSVLVIFSLVVATHRVNQKTVQASHWK